MNLIQIKKPSTSFAMPFKHRTIDDKVLITNTEGSFLLLTQDDFRAFAEGNIAPDAPLYKKLAERNFVRAEADTKKIADRMRTRKLFLNQGPNLHIVVVTLRCNETCVYCHASRADMEDTHTDMTKEIAEKTIDKIFATTNRERDHRVPGGRAARQLSGRQAHYRGRAREEQGGRQAPRVHDGEQPLAHGRGEARVPGREQGADLHQHRRPGAPPRQAAQAAGAVGAQVEPPSGSSASTRPTPRWGSTRPSTTSRRSSRRRGRRSRKWKEIVDTYVGLGCRALFLRPVDPFGFADKTGHRIEYPRSDYMEFYRSAVDYIIELNKQGVEILERFAAIFLTKILGGEDPNFLDIRNPCGAGIGQIAYNYDGKVFTCDEGRMLHEMGDSSFLIGDVATTSYRDLMGHETVRALAIASNLDAQPDCVNCTYQPYCGVCPVHSHRTQGTIFGRMRESSLCAVHKGIQDHLFAKLGGSDKETIEILKKWTTVRDRTHFLQTCAT